MIQASGSFWVNHGSHTAVCAVVTCLSAATMLMIFSSEAAMFVLGPGFGLFVGVLALFAIGGLGMPIKWLIDHQTIQIFETNTYTLPPGMKGTSVKPPVPELKPFRKTITAKLMGALEPPQLEEKEVGILAVSTQQLAVLAPHTTVASLFWMKPFAIRASRWPYEGQGVSEINLALRQTDAPEDAPWIAFRTLWPDAHMDIDALAIEREISPFIIPQAFGVLWRAVCACTRAQGGEPPEFFETKIDASTIEGLANQGPTTSCVACASTSVISVAPLVSRCNVCFYEG